MTITSTIISLIIDGVAFGRKTHHGSLTMFPIRSEGRGGLEYLTLAAFATPVDEVGGTPDGS